MRSKWSYIGTGYFCHNLSGFCTVLHCRNDIANGNKDSGHIQLEQEILTTLAGSGKLFALQVGFLQKFLNECYIFCCFR